MNGQQGWLRTGLFLATVATLLLELLDARLLSVLSWYHVSFFAVSLAMLGLSAGAVVVFLAGDAGIGEAGRRLLGKASFAFALSIPLSHVANLCIPIPSLSSLTSVEIAGLALSTAVLTVPFFLSGIVVTIALTRVGSRIGILYACDLFGAACGCLLIIPLLRHTDITSATLVCSVIGAVAALCFSRLSRPVRTRRAAVLCFVLGVAAWWNATSESALGVRYVKGVHIKPDAYDFTAWNTHSVVMAMPSKKGVPLYWGKGEGAPKRQVEQTFFFIDGLAGTAMTAWDGDPASLDWVGYDVTSLPYHLRSGDVAVIGVGGGRDLLSAIWARSTSITGVELNDILLERLTGARRDYAGIATRPEVALIHDEGRSFLTRVQRKFDIIQMSLIDTWAATGAGAFTLSENGLYTVEAWTTFLARLKPGGVLSVSRWFSPSDVSETSRMLSLGVATLLRNGAKRPADHIVLISRGVVATMLTSVSRFSSADLDKLHQVSQRMGFTIVAAPDVPPSNERLARILASTSPEELEQATYDPHFDYSPPTDQRPYFFNMLKPASFFRLAELGLAERADAFNAGVVTGNVRATTTLVALMLIACVLVSLIIVLPIARVGVPTVGRRVFVLSLLYFGLIGAGYMVIQIPFLQIFGVFLGHPVYAFSVILFSMILFSGTGSMLSDRLKLEGHRWHYGIPAAISLMLVVLVVGIPPILDATIGFRLAARCALVITLTAPVSILLGFCFPIGMRLVSRSSAEITAWAWGVNGACGVLASIAAVGVSLWIGINANLMIAAALYGGVSLAAVPLARLQR